MKRTNLTLALLATGLLLGSAAMLRAQRTVTVERVIHDLDRDLHNLPNKFARTLHHQHEAHFGENEAVALMLISAFAGEIRTLHTVVERVPRAQILTMLQVVDGTFQQADRAMRRAHTTESITADWERQVARYQLVRQAYGLCGTAHAHPRRRRR